MHVLFLFILQEMIIILLLSCSINAASGENGSVNSILTSINLEIILRLIEELK
jgi:hypothetical protein